MIRAGPDDPGSVRAPAAQTDAPEPPPGASATNRGRAGDRSRDLLSPRPYRGRHAGAAPVGVGQRPQDIDWAASVRAAAGRPTAGRPTAGADLWRKLRRVRPGRLLLFVLDSSGSMGGELTALAQRVALVLLREAYLRRDRLAVLAFCGSTAELLVSPTNQVEQVRRALAELPCGGTTPLARGMQLAHETLQRERLRGAGRREVLVLLSDGRANVGQRRGYAALQDEVEAAARALATRRDLQRVMLDTTEQGQPDAPARRLCRCLRAQRVRLSEVRRSGQDPAEAVGELLRSV